MPLVRSIRASGPLAIAVVALAVLVGCSSPTVKVISAGGPWPPAGSYAIAVEAKNAISSEEKRYFRRRLVESLKRSKAFSEILEPQPAVLPASALLVHFDIRFFTIRTGLFGQGKGARQAFADVRLEDSARTFLLAHFKVGAPGASLRSLANETVSTIEKLARGESLTRK